jgi:prepilin-type N-terminal cleavage/methylation domain-containing protein
MRTKFKAFTLVELLVGMIISALVISFCYSAYTIIYKQFLNYKNIKTQLVNAMQLNTILTTDFITSESVFYNEDKLVLNSLDKSFLIYSFNDGYILRTQNETTDTFKLVADEFKISYLSEISSFLVNEISFDATVLNEKEHFNFYKNYSAETAITIIQNKN